MTNPIRVDLFSDTITRPTAAMRKAMAEAEVGDEQKGEDPTTNRLAEMVAELTGKEKALFLPSGSMCNQIAIRVHCRHGDEIIADRTAHVYGSEVGGFAALSGASLWPVEGERGVFQGRHVAAAIRPKPSNHAPLSKLVVVEQTSNMGGGKVWPLETVKDVAATARHRGLKLHMDGARLMNAVVKSGVSTSEWASCFDSLWIDLSKGLGCPVGAVLAGSAEFIQEAWRWKHQFGGAMRQSGIIAAAGIYAFENNVERLAEDHENARLLFEGLMNIEGLRVEEPDTNMVFFDVRFLGLTQAEFCELTLAEGVRFSSGMAPSRVRAVTHLDVTSDDIKDALSVVEKVVRNLKESSVESV